MAGRMLKFASPLQSLTIPDAEVKDSLQSKRQSFLSKYKSGLQAEADTRKEIAAKRTKGLQVAAASGENWAGAAASREQNRRAQEEKLVEEAYDKAILEAKAMEKKVSGTSSNKYQFVGVVNRKAAGKKPITWYARPKPSESKWSVRLIHVNRDAIIKDLFNRGKVDIFAKYKNTGSVDEETNQPIVTSKYEARQRSWRYVVINTMTTGSLLLVLIERKKLNPNFLAQKFVELFAQALFYRFLWDVLERTSPSTWFIH
jgi:hypothetical protein